MVVKYDLRAEITEALHPVYTNLNVLDTKTENLHTRLQVVENKYNVNEDRITFFGRPSFKSSRCLSVLALHVQAALHTASQMRRAHGSLSKDSLQNLLNQETLSFPRSCANISRMTAFLTSALA